MKKAVIAAVAAVALALTGCSSNNRTPESAATSDEVQPAATQAPKTTTPPPTTQTPPPTTEAPPPPPQSGTGDNVLPVSITTPSVVEATYDGGSNFVIKTDGGELLVNTIGSYSGTTAVGFRGEQSSALIITASGPWTVQVKPLTSVPFKTLPLQGTGDDVFFIEDAPTALPIECPACEGNFVVWWWTADDTSLLVNEVGSYSGTVYAKGLGAMVVTAEGDWTVG